MPLNSDVLDDAIFFLFLGKKQWREELNPMSQCFYHSFLPLLLEKNAMRDGT